RAGRRRHRAIDREAGAGNDEHRGGYTPDGGPALAHDDRGRRTPRTMDQAKGRTVSVPPGRLELPPSFVNAPFIRSSASCTPGSLELGHRALAARIGRDPTANRRGFLSRALSADVFGETEPVDVFFHYWRKPPSGAEPLLEERNGSGQDQEIGSESGAQRLERAPHMLLDRAHGDAESGGDLGVR